MRVGLVVPCYIDVFYPEVGIAALELLEKLGVQVEYPFDQTCCWQPMANLGSQVKLVRLTPEPKPFSFGIVARKGRLSPATQKFWQSAKEAASGILKG